jgi:hypothetical protein
MKVSGVIRNSQGVAVNGLEIAAFDQDFRAEQELGSTRTKIDGRYTIDYTSEKFKRAEKRSADLLVEVRSRGKGRALRSPIHYNAPESLVVDLVLQDDFFGEAEFTRLLKDISVLTAESRIEIRALEDTEEHADVAFLSAELEAPAERVVYLILAHRLEHEANVRLKLGAHEEDKEVVLAEFFYALLRTDALTAFSPTRLHAIRFVAGLDIEIGALLDEVVLLPAEYATKSVDLAIERRIVEEALRERVGDLLQQLKRLAEDATVADDARAQEALTRLLGPTLDGGGIEALAEVLSQEHLGNIPLLVDRVQAALARRSEVSDETRATLELARFLGTDGPLIEGVKGHLNVGSDNEVRRLAAFDSTDWNETLTAAALAGAFGQRAPSELAMAREAERLSDRFAQRYPSASFTLRLAKASLLPEKEALKHIVEELPTFDLASTNVDSLFRDGKVARGAKPEARQAWKAALKATQRLYKLAPSEPHAKALLNENLASAQGVAALGREELVARLALHGVVEREAERIHERASQIRAGTVLLAGEIKSLGGSLDALVMKPAIAAAKLQQWKADFPNLKTLFDLQDMCECIDCRSVLSPAAYLADVLQFLKERKVLDSTNPGAPASRVAKDALFARRPDLGDIELDCSNAFTEIPYIDVVNELLEELVAPDLGFDFGGPVAEGSASPQLVQAVVSQGLPLGVRPVVAGPDLSGSFALRGTEASYKLVPDGAGGFKVKRTKQTHGTAEERAAAPEYVNADAYQALASKRIAFGMPFDAPQRQTVALFARFDVQRADLMRALAKGGSPSALGIAAAEMGISKRVADIIVNEESASQDEFWSTGAGLAVSTYKQVSAFLERTGVSYTELEDVKASLSGEGGLLRQPFVNPDGKLFIKHLKPNCDTSQKEIAGLDDKALDRLHRFIRLWRATGLTLAEVNLAVRHDSVGTGALDDAAFIRLGDVFRVARRTGQPAAQLLFLYGWAKDGWPGAVYNRIFANPSNGSAATDLAATAVRANEALAAGARIQIATKLTPIALSLARAPDEVDKLRELLADDDLRFTNLAKLYGLSAVARLAGLSVASFLALRRLSGIDPIAGPVETWSFLEVAQLLTGASIDPVDLERLLAVSATNPDPRIPGDASVKPILEKLQGRLAAAFASTRPAFDAALSPTENAQPLLDLLARLGDLDAAALGQVELLTRGRWTDPNETPGGFLDRVFGKIVDGAALTTVKNAWAAIPGGDPDAKTAQRNAFIAALASAASDALYERLRTAVATSAVSDGLKLDEQTAGVLLREAHLKAVPAVAADSLAKILTDVALITLNGAGRLPTVTPAAFPNAFAVVKLCAVIGVAASLLRLERRHVVWLLRQPSAAGFIELDRLPYTTALPALPFASVLRWLRARRLDDTYAPIDDPQAPGTTISLLDVMGMALSVGATAAGILPRVVTVTGWDTQALTALDTHFGFSAAGVAQYADPVAIATLETAMLLLKRIGITLADGLLVSKDVLSATDAAIARSALRVRYEPSDWLNVQKSIENVLREQRREALVAYLLATDSRFASSVDLFEYLLINVDMCACQPTSRIVQAHGTLQLFVERCLMGLEPSTVADTATDTGWKRWSWMSAYRVWEANRRVFLYPENWIEPELRDDKSPFFKDLERELAQSELTDRAAEDAAGSYLEKLDEVAFLEHLACHFDSVAGILHVFARTKGGDPATYYYRQLIKEREWTSWEKVELDISADHLVAFIRNGRLYLAWPIFEEEAESKPDGEPIPTAPGGGTAPPPNKRLKIKLALSEYSNGKWLPKKLSKDGLVSGSYVPQPPKPEIYRFTAVDAGDAGYSIVVTTHPSGRDEPTPDRFFGAFAITGCKGYPEPTSLGNSELVIDFSPRFKDTDLRANRPAERGADKVNDFALFELPAPTFEQQLFRNTPDGNAGVSGGVSTGALSASFKVAYPWQMTSLDQLLGLIAMLTSAQHGISGKAMQRYGLPVAFGTFLPFFFEDRNRILSLVPGWFSKERRQGSGEIAVTASDVIPIFDELWPRILKAYRETIEKGAPAIEFVRALLADPVLIADVRKLVKLFVGNRFGYRVDNAFHPLVCFFRRTLNEKGLSGLLTRDVQLKTTGFDFSSPGGYAPTALVVQPYPVEDVDFRKEGAYSSYNWELFFHLPFSIAVTLSKNQRFEDAMRWFHYVFDPTGSLGGSAPQKYWVTAPFYRHLASDYAAQRIDSILYEVAQDPTGLSLGTLADAIEDWRDRPFRPHVIARSRSVAYQKAVLIKYIQNLIAWGDYAFRQETMESVNRADQLYVLAEKLLGPKPRFVPPVVEPRAASFNELEPKLDLLSNALLDLENLVPDPSLLPHGGAELPPPPTTLTSLYFCIPPNDKMLDYWTTVADRRFKITHCKTIDGADRTLALFAPRIDPADLVRAVAQGLPIGAILAGLGAPIPPYRFQVIAQKAIEFIQELRTLGQELEQALEKRDGEALALVRGTLEIELLEKLTAMKEEQIREAAEQTKAIQRSIDTTRERLTFYQTRKAVSDLEVVALVLQGLSGVSQGVSAALSAAAGVVNLLPNVNIGVAGFGGSPTVTVTWGSSNVAGGLSSFAGAAGSLAGVFGTAGSMVGTIAGYERRKDEWDFQGRLADKEITQLNQQVTVAKIREEVTKKDLAGHKKQIENARKTDAFMRSKFTNRELFEWMAGEVSAIYFQAYDLAFAMAKKAERCFQHELGTSDTFVQYGSWDSLRKGIGAANPLMQQLRRMEASFYERNRRDYELVKHVSLAALDPMALLKLKVEGKCTVTVPEALFDLDHTGHYMRRLKSVSLSVPCTAGPYGSVACRLTLLSNRYRRSQTAANAAAYPENAGQDDRFVYNIGGIQSIATSQGQNDSGMFELNFKDERYLPFEGSGAIGSWQIEFGSQFRSFDPASLSDVILHIHYTAREGGSGLKNAADGALVTRLNQIENEVKKAGLLRAIDLRHEAPDAWARLLRDKTAKFTVSSDMLPQFTIGHAPTLSDGWVLIRATGQPASFAFSLDGTPMTANKDVLVKGLCSTQLPGPLPIAIDKEFTVAAAKAGELESAYLLVRYQIT